MYSAFQSFIEDEIDFKEINLPEKELEILKETLKEKIKPIKVSIKSKLSISSTAPDGIEIIKDAIKQAKAFAKKKNYDIEISYLGAPRYSLSITSSDYKLAEDLKREIQEKIINLVTEKGGKAEIVK